MEVQSPVYLSENVFVELGIMSLPDERKFALLDQMNELVQKRVMLQLVEVMPEGAQQELSALKDADEETVMEKMTEMVPSLPEIIVTETDAVKDGMRAVVLEAVA
jgi:hypothetical protein